MLNIRRNGWWYHSPCPIELCASMSLNISSIPRSPAFSLNSGDVKLFSQCFWIVLDKPLYTEYQQLTKLFQRLVADLSVIKTTF